MKLPKYDENVLSKVAFDFELSGGQIDNIIRKLEIEFILNRAYPNEASFIDLCEQEQILSKNQSNKIGF
jgi:hypothetical protein